MSNAPAAIALNPEDERQVEVVARAIATHLGDNPDEEFGGPSGPRVAFWTAYTGEARAVLRALKEMT